MRDRGPITSRRVGGRVADSGSQITHPSAPPPPPAAKTVRLSTLSVSLALALSSLAMCMGAAWESSPSRNTVGVVCGAMYRTVASAFALFFFEPRTKAREP
ncbi:hypothetical protein P5V15_010525 [Pogonomyrmex californicus]